MAISPQRLTMYLYSAHRAVIFAIAQLSCNLLFPICHHQRLPVPPILPTTDTVRVTNFCIFHLHWYHHVASTGRKARKYSDKLLHTIPAVHVCYSAQPLPVIGDKANDQLDAMVQHI